jgi:hypothetical protein
MRDKETQRVKGIAQQGQDQDFSLNRSINERLNLILIGPNFIFRPIYTLREIFKTVLGDGPPPIGERVF